MAIISAIREYIAECPLLHDGAILGVDQLEADTIGYTVDTTPCEPVVQKYTDGSDKRQFLFVFASREKYGERVLENIGQGIFPELGDYRTPYRMDIVSSGYAYDTGDDTARYQIQLRLMYYQDRRYFTHG